jgi:hypothetical protein
VQQRQHIGIAAAAKLHVMQLLLLLLLLAVLLLPSNTALPLMC